MTGRLKARQVNPNKASAAGKARRGKARQGKASEIKQFKAYQAKINRREDLQDQRAEETRGEDLQLLTLTMQLPRKFFSLFLCSVGSKEKLMPREEQEAAAERGRDTLNGILRAKAKP